MTVFGGEWTMRKWMIVAATAWLAAGSAWAASPAAPSEAQVRELFEAMHLDQMFGQMNTQIVGAMSEAVPCIPSSYWQNFIDAGNRDQLLARMVPIYQQHFTQQDVTGLLKFYRSALGQKVITQMPMTMAEGMKIGQAWGRERAEGMIKELQQAGKLDAAGRCPATPGH